MTAIFLNFTLMHEKTNKFAKKIEESDAILADRYQKPNINSKILNQIFM